MRLIRFASTVICLIVIASFITFAADQTKSAASRQRELVSPAPAAQSASAVPASEVSTPARSTQQSTVHRDLEEAAADLTSPFSGLVSSASSEWEIRAIKLFAALVVYGFGLGYLAQALRVRV